MDGTQRKPDLTARGAVGGAQAQQRGDHRAEHDGPATAEDVTPAHRKITMIMFDGAAYQESARDDQGSEASAC